MSRLIKQNYKAQDIIRLLADRHIKDVFVPECKDGATQTRRHMRMDAWAMNRSWAHPCSFGYEIKISRSDFIQDNKWPGYLPFCNQFYFVAPPGIIEPAELSNDCGLMVVAGAGPGTRLLTKKKAPYRAVAIPEDLYRYILMCRAQIAPEDPLETTVERWRKWLAQEQEDRRLGYEVSKAIRKKAEQIEHENLALVAQMQTYDHLRSVLESLGVNLHCWNPERQLRDKIEAHTKVFDPDTIGRLQSTARLINEMLVSAEAFNAPESGNGKQ